MLLVHLTHAIGAAVQTVLAANALVLVDKHIARLGITVARARGTHCHALRVLALLALRGQPVLLDIGESASRADGYHLVVERPERQTVFKLAGHDAAVAARAAIEVYEQSLRHLEHLLGDRLVLQRRHERLEFLALHPDALRAIALLDFHRERAIAVRGETRVLE